MSLPDNVAPLAPDDPCSLADYELIGRIGTGGMGVVYLGRGMDGRLVAIKTIRPHLATEAEYRARFHEETLLACRVAGFCTAPVIDHGEENGLPYLVSEYVSGTPLNRYVHEHGRLSLPDLHGVAIGVAAALAAIHAAGLVHRDLKPANVLLSLSGPRVIDFGIAHSLDTSPCDDALGTPGWAAPEQSSGGRVTPAADIFAWGCLVAYGGTGRHPFGTGDSASLAYRVNFEEPYLGNLSGILRDLVTAALAKDPALRPSAPELLLALVGKEHPGPPGPEPPPPSSSEPSPPYAHASYAHAEAPAAYTSPPTAPTAAPWARRLWLGRRSRRLISALTAGAVAAGITTTVLSVRHDEPGDYTPRMAPRLTATMPPTDDLVGTIPVSRTKRLHEKAPPAHAQSGGKAKPGHGKDRKDGGSGHEH